MRFSRPKRKCLMDSTSPKAFMKFSTCEACSTHVLHTRVTPDAHKATPPRRSSCLSSRSPLVAPSLDETAKKKHLPARGSPVRDHFQGGSTRPGLKPRPNRVYERHTACVHSAARQEDQAEMRTETKNGARSTCSSGTGELEGGAGVSSRAGAGAAACRAAASSAAATPGGGRAGGGGIEDIIGKKACARGRTRRLKTSAQRQWADVNCQQALLGK